MYGYTFFSVDQSGKIYDDFVIASNLETAKTAHLANASEDNIGPVMRTELVVRSSFPYRHGSEEEITVQGGNEVAKPLGFVYSRCLCCLDFFKTEDVIQVEPFGEEDFDLACHDCIEVENLKPVNLMESVG